MSKRIFAAGCWPRGFYIECVGTEQDDEEVTYEALGDRIYVGDRPVGEALEELEARLAYEHHGDIRCGWCDRPLDECRTDPCDHYAD